MSARACLCQGRPLNELVAAFAARTRRGLATQLREGKQVEFKQMQLTAYLVKALAEGRKSAFDARYRTLDHHLPECPCSPRFQAARQAVDTTSGQGLD